MATVEFTRRFPGDPTASREFVTFSEEAIQSPGKSEQAGRPIYDMVEMVSIRFPGNNLTEIVRKVTPEDKERWAPQYAAFKKGGGGTVVDGTPLEAWTALNKAQVREFQAMNIFSVEQLSAVDDYFCQRIGMGGRMWRDRAKMWLEAAADNARIDAVAAELLRRNEQVEVQNRQITELGALCENLRLQLQAMQTNALNAPRTIPGVPEGMSTLNAPTFPPAAPAQGSIGETSTFVEPRKVGRPKKDAAA